MSDVTQLADEYMEKIKEFLQSRETKAMQKKGVDIASIVKQMRERREKKKDGR